MSGSVEVEAVQGWRAASEFHGLPYRLYQQDPLWVAPLRSVEARRWDPRHNPVLRTRQTARFLAHRGGRVVGRIAAVVDRAFAERWTPDSGFFGFFECERDPDASRALFEAAEGWLRDQGVRLVLGPVHFSFHYEVGLLAGVASSSPMLLSPYNPAYYTDLVRGAGYAPRTTYRAYLWTPESRHTDAVERILRRAKREAGARIRCVDPRRFDEELGIVFCLYNAAFKNVFGFVPIDWEELQALAESFRPFLRPDLVFIAEQDGSPVGFSLTLPNVNEALHGLHGRLLPLGWLRLVRRVPRVRTARYILLGVEPDWIARGLAVRLAQATVDAARRAGYARVELSLVHGENRRIQHVIEAFGCPPVHEYVLYGRSIA